MDLMLARRKELAMHHDISRARLLGGLGALACVTACAPKSGSPAVTIGSKNFTESLILGEMYAAALEHAGITVTRKMNLGGTQIAMAALRKGEIDAYPEYTGTGLIDVLHYEVPHGPHPKHTIYEIVKEGYAKNFKLEWLAPSPFNDSQGMACTQATSDKYAMKSLSDLAKAAPKLRCGAVPEFVNREDALPGLRRVYGGFQFKEIRLLANGLKYDALRRGFVDVVVAFTTEGQIAAEHLWVFTDDKHFWPSYNVAPVVRPVALKDHPQMQRTLDAIAPLLTDEVMRTLNYQVEGPQKKQPADVARAFLQAHQLA